MNRCVGRLLVILILILLSWLQSHAREAERLWRIDDFEDGDLRAAPGLSWIALADDLAGGASTGRLEAAAGGAEGSKGALRIAGRLSGRPRSFVGAWVSLDRAGGAVDLSGFDRIRLRVRGGGRLLVGLRDGTTNHMAPIETGSDWRLVEVPFDRLEPQGAAAGKGRLDPAALWSIGVTTPYLPPGGQAPAADVSFEIDDVEVTGRGEGPSAPEATGAPGSIRVLPFTSVASIPADGWIELATDPAGDANAPLLPDATRLEVHQGAPDGMVWFRVTLRETPHERWMGMNVALDTDGDPGNGQPWWGANGAFRFDRLVTVYCFEVASECQGYVGVADAAQAAAGDLSGGREPLRFAIDRGRRAFVVGVPRPALHLGPGPAGLVAAVGSAIIYGDDIPSRGAALLR